MRSVIFLLVLLFSIGLAAGCTDGSTDSEPAMTLSPSPSAAAQQLPALAPAPSPTATPVLTPSPSPTPDLNTQEGVAAIEDMLEQLDSFDLSDIDYSE